MICYINSKNSKQPPFPPPCSGPSIRVSSRLFLILSFYGIFAFVIKWFLCPLSPLHGYFVFLVPRVRILVFFLCDRLCFLGLLLVLRRKNLDRFFLFIGNFVLLKLGLQVLCRALTSRLFRLLHWHYRLYGFSFWGSREFSFGYFWGTLKLFFYFNLRILLVGFCTFQLLLMQLLGFSLLWFPLRICRTISAFLIMVFPKWVFLILRSFLFIKARLPHLHPLLLFGTRPLSKLHICLFLSAYRIFYLLFNLF